MKLDKKKIIQILKHIRNVEDVELKDCAIESLIDMLQDTENNEASDK